jgi:hypothetical protein
VQGIAFNAQYWIAWGFTFYIVVIKIVKLMVIWNFKKFQQTPEEDGTNNLINGENARGPIDGHQQYATNNQQG